MNGKVKCLWLFLLYIKYLCNTTALQLLGYMFEHNRISFTSINKTILNPFNKQPKINIKTVTPSVHDYM